MSASAYVGRVGTLAVALGVGAAVLTAPGVAWAEPTSESSETSSESTRDAAEQSDPVDSPAADQDSDAEPDPDPDADLDTNLDTDTEADPETGATTSQAPPGVTVSTGGAVTSGSTDDEDEEEDENDPAPTQTPTVEREPAREQSSPSKPDTDDVSPPAAEPVTSVVATEVVTRAAPDHPTTLRVAPTALAVTPPPAVPSLRPWPTAFDPISVVTYVTGVVSSLVSAVLSPFAAGMPALPADPSPWALLAWVRRELFNQTPTITYNASQNTQSLNVDGDVVVTGHLGIGDGDGDAHTIDVVGRPLNGGVVSVAADGTFTYRPTNAMAAVGGVDRFTVVVDDAAAGLHVHGPLGLLQFVPILGNFLNPGAGHRVAKTITVTVSPVDGIDLSFPDGFHWGVAHAGFQAEGGPGSPVDPNSDWYKWVHDPIIQFLGLTNGVPENGPGAYVKYDGDAQLAREELGMNTFRMSIEWSRIFPNSTAQVNVSDQGGEITLADLQAMDALANQAEVAHYRDVLTSLRAHDLEPMVTVVHFALPSWIHDPIAARPLIQLGLPAQAAGWLSPSTPIEFRKYAAYLAWKYGDQVDNWATINEPFPPVLTQFFAIPGLVPAWPPGVIRPDLAATFLVNQAAGHVGAYDALHQWDTTVATAGQQAAFVGFTNNMIPARPSDPRNPLDVQAADAWNQFYNDWFPNAVIDGWVDANLDGVKTVNEVHAEFTDKVDWLGVQYYGSQPMQGFGLAPVPGFPFLRGLPIRCAAESPTCSDFNQPIDPGGFREVLEIAASYGKPVWITENGIADDEDTKRPGYIVNHLAVVQDLLAHGTDIRGYTYWSFVDNLEWADGYHLQFGLYGSDPTTPELERTPKPASIEAISSITTANALPTGLLGSYVPQL
ncbi:family 1 glycosylhydrolase [Mycolicibacterium lacusdiani]|uniref:family 1 glycosylhydrolase n=1 Tax=Mycolicibacterium lacusdiani TaxID=2895283 RepID=UPI001F030A59|nr:family 1 glycosylhydrolase [Mycolicibacterium lacusdiani]